MTKQPDIERRRPGNGALARCRRAGCRFASFVWGATPRRASFTFGGATLRGETISSGGVSFAYNFQNQFVQGGGLTATYDPSSAPRADLRDDGHGNVRFLTSMAGTVTDTYEYDAFGNEIAGTGSTPNSYLFNAQQFDPALGFYYMRARYYRPATGRFWTPDPIEGKLCCGLSWNPYIYALDSP